MPGAIPQGSSSAVGNDDASSLSMRDLENEIVDISSSTNVTPKVKLLFAKSKGTTKEGWCLCSVCASHSKGKG